ncbi:MAG TPA: hypothetical protein VFF28_02625 [Candidatus Nanoarchaeia archaeon]|nr:hypothetical protein [Candidatus Nanoarchaeia archaeon]
MMETYAENMDYMLIVHRDGRKDPNNVVIVTSYDRMDEFMEK